MEDENRTANSAIWAMAMIMIVAMLVGGVYYFTKIHRNDKNEIDINVTAPH